MRLNGLTNGPSTTRKRLGSRDIVLGQRITYAILTAGSLASAYIVRLTLLWMTLRPPPMKVTPVHYKLALRMEEIAFAKLTPQNTVLARL